MCLLKVNAGTRKKEDAESSSSAGYYTDESCSPTPPPLESRIHGTTLSSGSRLIIAEEPSDNDDTAMNYCWTNEQLTDRYV